MGRMSRILDKISKPERGADRVYKGFNFLSYDDRDLLFALVRGEHVITGLKLRELLVLPQLASPPTNHALPGRYLIPDT
jgi:hypothetical protein